MKRSFTFLALLLASTLTILAQEPPAPEQCLAAAEASAVVVQHGGKPYRLASEACRAQFLSDPERFSQLYDALLELAATGAPIEARPASLVPS